jgi:hypothetical protein
VGPLSGAQDAHLTLNHAAEIIGKIQPDLSVKVLQATDFGAGFGRRRPLPCVASDVVGGPE